MLFCTSEEITTFALRNQRRAPTFCKSRLTPLFYQKTLKRASLSLHSEIWSTIHPHRGSFTDTIINVSYFPMVSGSATNLDEFKTARAESPTPNRAVRKGCYSIDA